MLYSLIGFISFFAFFITMLICIALGQVVGKRQLSTSGLSVTEGAVFTLMALLVAFTFASANQRYDERRMMITEETNAISTAFLRLDLLTPPDQSLLKKDFLSYITSRLAIYHALPDVNKSFSELIKSKKIQIKIWNEAIKACQRGNFSCNMLLLPSLNNMFDIANTRTSFTYYHAHYLIFVLLVLVALSSAFLTGYGISKQRAWNSVHVLAFALIMAITIYMIIDFEFPRFGLIQETAFDKQMVELKSEIANKSLTLIEQ